MVAMTAHIFWWTSARIVIGTVHAGGPVEAWRNGTVVNIHLASITSETVGTKADVTVELISARSIVHARHRSALVYIYVAVTTTPAGLANTSIISY